MGFAPVRRAATFPLLFGRSAVLGWQSTQEELNHLKKQI
jgi:hypothetical protein